MEIFWTALGSLIKKDFRLIGTTSVWMFFIYGAAVLFEPVCVFMGKYPVLIRGTAYVLLIFSIEFFTGTLLKKASVCPWDYSDAKYSVRGVIRLDYAPAWFFVGLMFEKIYFTFAG